MKNFIWLVLCVSMVSFADEADLAGIETFKDVGNSSQPKEEMKCYPMSTVRKWAKRKKKPAEVKIIEKVIEKTIIQEAPKNNLSLLAGRTQTGLKGTKTVSSPVSTLEAHNTGEFDLGLMYQRRLTEHIRATAIGTMNGSFYGGLGYDF